MPQLIEIERYLGEHPPLHLMVESYILGMSQRGKKGGRARGGKAPVVTDEGRGTMEDLARVMGAQLPQKKNPEVNRG